jgi:hypothetical protein
MPLVIGSRLGPYEIVSAIGAGGMGEVYRARDTRLGREVAVKVLPEGTASISDRLTRFEREAKAVAALNHPNILALHDIGSDSGIAYAVMELLEGETLRARLGAARQLSPLKALNYASQIARGLAAAHERGIVHRDLKPENLFITTDGRVKILDFGLSQQEPTGASELAGRETRFTTEPGIMVGTPGYMSPEQVIGQAATARSDLFAFGVVVHEMLTGSHPFRRDTIADTVTAILREDPPPLRRALPDLPAGLVGVLESCLEKRSDDRPSSARDIALFLEAAGSSNESGTWQRVAPADVRRLRNRMVAISCGLLILLSATTWTFVRTMANRVVAAAIEADLARAERLVQRVEREKLAALAVTARLVASFPELRALFATDAPTIRDYLLSYQQRNPDVPMLVALGPDRTVVASTAEASSASRDDEWIAALLDTPGEGTLVQMRDRPYHAAAAAADVGGYVFGYVVAAIPVDQGFAGSLREATQDEVVILSDTGVLASTLRAGQTPWRSRDEWHRSGGRTDGATEVSIGAQRFAAREVRLADRPAIGAIVLKSRDEAVAPFRRIQDGVIVIGLLCVSVAALGSLWIARTLTAPSPPAAIRR